MYMVHYAMLMFNVVLYVMSYVMSYVVTCYVKHSVICSVVGHATCHVICYIFCYVVLCYVTSSSVMRCYVFCVCMYLNRMAFLIIICPYSFMQYVCSYDLVCVYVCIYKYKYKYMHIYRHTHYREVAMMCRSSRRHKALNTPQKSSAQQHPFVRRV